ncbi:DUF2764 family protein [candidate division KSB1 bacterium]|nr:DUF2764 family protein [candidate division KSB1 bacterium]
MDRYYYFISTLPMLFFDREVQLQREVFLDEASRWLSGGDYKILTSMDMRTISGEIGGHPIARWYSRFETGLRRETAAWRTAQKNNQDYKTTLFPVALLKEGNPLDVEKKLLKLRWDELDERERDYHFDLAYVMIYYLKLQILYRLSTFNKEKGLEKFQKLYEVNVWTESLEK